MRKSFRAFLLASFAALSVSSASAGLFPFPNAVNGDDVTIAVAADAAWLSGRAREQVFARGAYPETLAGSGSNRHRMSRLDWDLKNVFLVGGAGSIRTWRVSFNGGIWAGAGLGGSGVMEEWDWLVGDTPDARATPANGANACSRSDATVTTALVADGNVAFDLLDGDSAFALFPFAGFRLDRYEWEAENGWRTDSGNGGIRTEMSGKSIEYELDCVQAYFGLGGSCLLGRRFRLSAYGRFAPVYRAKDHEKRIANHYIAENRTDRDWFEDVAYGLGARAEWALTPHCCLAASVDWSRYAFAEAKTKVRDAGEDGEDVAEEDEEEEEKPAKNSKKDKDDGKDAPFAGIELENLTVSLGIVWRF
ncbi:MAG: omptin family outer membrane protease [Kiritimatiellae bacterium]|nr:omptin family outer membrane protease [Kiritimatiellia bacterium]